MLSVPTGFPDRGEVRLKGPWPSNPRGPCGFSSILSLNFLIFCLSIAGNSPVSSGDYYILNVPSRCPDEGPSLPTCSGMGWLHSSLDKIW